MEKSVYFRALEPEDAELIYQWHNDAEMMKNAVGKERFWSKQDCRDWVAARSKRDNFNFWFAICLNDESKKMIGYFGINKVHYVNRSATSDAIVIGDKEHRDGFAWIETYLYMKYFVFEVLHLHRFYGSCMATQKQTLFMTKLLYAHVDGIIPDCYFKNNQYIDEVLTSSLDDEYFMHKNNGDFEMKALLKRIRQLREEEKEKEK